MTRKFNDTVHCPHCGEWHTVETAFERWMRNNPALDSKSAGIVRFDCDVLLHKYMTLIDKRGSREIQAAMFIEVKTNWADVSPAQRDSLSMMSQVFRNRRKNMHSDRSGRHAEDHAVLCTVYSHIRGDYVRLRLFGGHLLQFERNAPGDGGQIAWDYQRIDEATLEKLLRFELDPDTNPLKPFDLRRRSSSWRQEQLQGRLF